MPIETSWRKFCFQWPDRLSAYTRQVIFWIKNPLFERNWQSEM